MTKFSKYIGLDVQKETIAVAVADGAGGKPRYWGEIKNRPEAGAATAGATKRTRRAATVLL